MEMNDKFLRLVLTDRSSTQIVSAKLQHLFAALSSSYSEHPQLGMGVDATAERRGV